ncbi:MAG: gamma-glutamyl-gamma-aminobutyrate hydrolase family protein [Candidatus Aminicenantes bacterium]|nr:MAG: gamma-glutamyl-gamma-aminobutyrate hydrolase family protein [Candidatus Aminicenantes bacterium]
MIKLAIIDNAIDHSIYNPIRHWKICLENDFVVFKATSCQFPDIQDFTHIILTGSEASILHREKWVYDEIELVKEAAERGVALLGSCYGHQLLAVALAGPHYVQKCANPEIGWISISINRVDDFLGDKRSAYCFSSHLDEVTEMPDEFLVFASSDSCQVQGFRLRNQPIWGLQIHPEMNINEAQWYLEKRVENKHEPLHLFQAAMNSQPRDSRLILQVVKNFVG